MEHPIGFPLKAGPEICYEYLSTLVEADCRPFKAMFVIQAWEIVNNEIDKGSSATVSFLNAGDEATIKALRKISKGLGIGFVRLTSWRTYPASLIQYILSSRSGIS